MLLACFEVLTLLSHSGVDGMHLSDKKNWLTQWNRLLFPMSHKWWEVCTCMNTVCGAGVAVYNHWTGLLEWTTGMDYWTDLFFLHHFYDL